VGLTVTMSMSKTYSHSNPLHVAADGDRVPHTAVAESRWQHWEEQRRQTQPQAAVGWGTRQKPIDGKHRVVALAPMWAVATLASACGCGLCW